MSVRSGQSETSDTMATVTAVLFQRDTTPTLIYTDSGILLPSIPTGLTPTVFVLKPETNSRLAE